MCMCVCRVSTCARRASACVQSERVCLPLDFALVLTLPLSLILTLTRVLILTLTRVLIVTNGVRSLGLRLFAADLRSGVGRCEGRALRCAGQRAAQLAIFATLQRRRTAAALLLITSLALESARGVGSRGQLEQIGGLARVAGTALHASGECLVRWAFHLCNKQQKVSQAA
jgi:hypothetical protein